MTWKKDKDFRAWVEANQYTALSESALFYMWEARQDIHPARPQATTIVLDPPWPNHGGGVRSAARKYPTLHPSKMPGVIMGHPFWNPNPEGCRIWMWAISNFLGEAQWLMKALGATLVTDWIWRKTSKSGGLRTGTGQHRRGGHEVLLLGRIGRVGVPATNVRQEFPSVIDAPVGEHSAKPVRFYELFEAHDPDGQWVEFFARSHRRRWLAMGNQLETKTDVLPNFSDQHCDGEADDHQPGNGEGDGPTGEDRDPAGPPAGDGPGSDHPVHPHTGA